MAIFTVGYGGKKLDKLIALLKHHSIDLVIDIRRFPKSANPDYDRENLERFLSEAGISYIFMGEELGGLRRSGYVRHMQTELYRQGIRRLLKTASGHNVTLMCKERNDSGCHRRYIVETLLTQGVKIAPLESNEQGRLL